MVKKNKIANVLAITMMGAIFLSSSARAELEEIIVTAQKREQSLQDIGLTVAAFGGERLKEAAVTDVVDVASLTPNVQVNYGLGNNFFNIRGLGLNEFVANLDAPVAVHVDEVYQSKGFMTGLTLFDVERVEVLKGPQGDLFGRNTTGGAINFITRKPENEFGGYINVGYGNYEALNLEGAVNIPFSESLSGRLSGYVTDQGEGFYTNTTGTEQVTDDSGVTRTRVFNDPSQFSSDEGYVDEFGVRGQLLWEFENTEILASVHYGKDDSQLHPYEGAGIKDNSGAAGGSFVFTSALCLGYLTGSVTGTTANCSRGLDVDALAIAAPITVGGVAQNAVINQNGSFSYVTDILLQPGDNDPFTTEGNLTFEVDNEAYGAFLRVDHDLADSVFTSITAYENFEQNQREDSDGSLLQSVEVYWHTELEQFTQEFRLTSDFDTDDWSYIVGAFIEHDELTNGDYLTAYETLFGSAFNNYSSYDQTVTALSLFGHLEFQVTDQLRFISGVRYTYEDTELVGGTFSGLGITDVGGQERPEFGVDGVTPFDRTDAANIRSSAAALPNGGNQTEENVSYRFGLNYTPSDDLLVYGSITTGFRSGGFSVAFANNQGELQGESPTGGLEPETITAYELGFKSSWGDDFRLNGALYRYDLQNAHLDVDGNGAVPVTVNGDEVEIFGAELESQWSIADGLTFESGLGLIDSKISDNSLVVSAANAGIIPNLDAATTLGGNSTSFSPELSFTGQLRYEVPLSDALTGIASTDFSWRDEAFLEANNQPTNLRDDYWLVNARLALRSEDGNWELAAWGKNLTDEAYQVYLNDLPAFGWLLNGYAAPRTYGVSFNYEF